MFNKSSSSSKSSSSKASSSGSAQRGFDPDADLSTSMETLHLKDPSIWSKMDVVAWLESLELSEYKRVFWDNAVTGSVLVGLSEDDLKSLNVSKLGDRKRLLKEIGKIAGKKTTSSDSKTKDSHPSDSDSDNDKIYLKLHFEDDVRALVVDASITLRKLRREVRGLYDSRMKMQYKDEDGDYVSLRSEKDLSTLIRGIQVTGRKRVKIYLSKKSEDKAREDHDAAAQARSAAFSVFDAFLDPVIVINDAGIVQHANPATEQLTGWKPSEVSGKNVNVLMTDEYKRFHDSYLRTYIKTRAAKIIGTGRDVVLQKKDGSIIPIHLQVTEKTVMDKTYFFGTMKKAAESAQTKSMLQQEREVLDSLVTPAIIIDETGMIHGFNSAVQKLTGYSLVDVINRNINMLMTSPDKEKHDSYLKRYIETNKAKIIGTGRKVMAQAKDGSLKTLFLSVTEKQDKSSGKRIFTGILQEVNA